MTPPTHLRPSAAGRVLRAAAALTLSACNIDYQVVENDGQAGAGAGSGMPLAGGPSTDALIDAGVLVNVGQGDPVALPPSSCVQGGYCAPLGVGNVDKVDLLFVVDNSGSMLEEQAALRAQIPRLITMLTTGDRDGDGTAEFAPAKDLHLGVVSSDLGLVGIDSIPLCQGLGDDAVLNAVPSPDLMGCQRTYPSFLTHTAGTSEPAQTAIDLACIATLGTHGCGFEQQLEAGLKALWPSSDDRITFFGGELPGALDGGMSSFGASTGQGDRGNAGFLRNDPALGLSVLAVVLLTDEDDCSRASSSFLAPAQSLEPGDPLLEQGLNTRCSHNAQDLFDVQERYVNGLRALRPGNEHLVVFSAIVGVPPDLVSGTARSQVDFSNPMERDAYYQRMLDDDRMQVAIDDRGTPDVPDDDNLKPSCDTAAGLAYPPQRIVEAARGFGEQGLVQSLCQDDLAPAIDAIAPLIGRALGAECLSPPLTRQPDGTVACDVLWELPAPGTAPASTPVECSQSGYEFLLPPGADRPATSDSGGTICEVAQLAVLSSGTAMTVPTDNQGRVFIEGWYYDDFSSEVAEECRNGHPQRIAFSSQAKPPSGVRVILDCAPAATASE